MESVGDIKRRLSACSPNELEQVLEELSADGRKGVQSLTAAFRKKQEALRREQERTEKLWEIERECLQKGFQTVGGIDEVGRGPLAGPVIAAFVLLKPDSQLLYINDSKKLSAQKREFLAEEIKKEALCVSIGAASAEEIDRMNILQATYHAMQLAVSTAAIQADFLLVDALTIPKIRIPQKGIVHGDARSISIGAASIVAKVYRDTMMTELDKLFPEYGFAEHKGYGTPSHIEAIRKFGPCPLHRKTFLKNIV